MDYISQTTGSSFLFGFIDADHDLSLGTGPRQTPDIDNVGVTGTLDGNDTMSAGSGTKAFTATAVMRLVGAGKIKLKDLAYKHIDP